MQNESELIFKDPKYQYWSFIEQKMRRIKDRFQIPSGSEEEMKFCTTPIGLGDETITDPDVLFMRPIVCQDLIRIMQDTNASEDERREAMECITGGRLLAPDAMFNWVNIVVSNQIDAIVDNHRQR